MLIQRTEYLNKLIAFKDKQLVKIVTGVRRCGKSTLLKLYQDWLMQQGVGSKRILSVNFEDIDYEELMDYKRLYAYIKKRLTPNEMTYIFLDEIQHVDNFPRLVGILQIKKILTFILPAPMRICSQAKSQLCSPADMCKLKCCPFPSKNICMEQEIGKAAP